MTAPTFSFTVTGATHDDVMAEANRVAKGYWGRHRYHIVDVAVNGDYFRQMNGDRPAMQADVITKQDTVIS